MNVSSPCGGGHGHVFERGGNLQRMLAHFLSDFRQKLFRHAELDVNRMNLVDGDQRVVRRLDDVARVSLQAARLAINRGTDMTKFQIQERVGDGRLVCRHGASCCVEAGLVRFRLILRNNFVREQFLIARIIGHLIFQLPGVACQICARLIQRRLRRARVNREQQRIRFHLVAFLEMHLLQNAADLRMDGRRRDRHHVADRRRVNLHRQVGCECPRHQHRRGRRGSFSRRPNSRRPASLPPAETPIWRRNNFSWLFISQNGF